MWLQRWKLEPVTIEEQALLVAQVREQSERFVAEREAWLAQHQDFTSTFRYKRPSWMYRPELELPYDVTMLHILNHGPHHSAQAINMLKRLGRNRRRWIT